MASSRSQREVTKIGAQRGVPEPREHRSARKSFWNPSISPRCPARLLEDILRSPHSLGPTRRKSIRDCMLRDVDPLQQREGCPTIETDESVSSSHGMVMTGGDRYLGS